LKAEIEDWYADFHQRMPPVPGVFRDPASGDLDEILMQYVCLLDHEFRRPFSYRLEKRKRDTVKILKTVVPLLRERKVRVLDAGCGFGTDAILFGLCGAEVIGVDLFPGLVEIAHLRKRLYQEYFDTGLDIEFRAEHLLNMSGDLTYNAIWSNSSIEHIHPVDDFLQICFEKLLPGGKLLIVNENGLNPYSQLKQLYIRGFKLYYDDLARDPISGERVVYAMERLLTLPGLKRELDKAGFDISEIVDAILIPAPFAQGRLCYQAVIGLEKMLARIPLPSPFQQVHVLVAEKPQTTA
jgi:SAM-dependent methyltransferase